jgi:PAS domain S-box-containing protein
MDNPSSNVPANDVHRDRRADRQSQDTERRQPSVVDGHPSAGIRQALPPTAGRESGLALVGNVPWGSHFCQFYQTPQDLLDVLVPYFCAGLEHNEFCVWITSEPLHAEGAKAALASVVPDLDHRLAAGQIEILDYHQWYVRDGRFEADRVLQGWVEKLQGALQRGYEGLRLTGNTFWLQDHLWKDFADYEAAVDAVIGRYRMLALCTYSLDKCGAFQVMDVVRNHRFALIRQGERWEIIQSTQRQATELALRESEHRYHTLFDTMREGFGLHEILCDSAGRPCDYRFLEINPAFERQTGLKSADLIGRTVREVLPGIEPIWIERYGRVALTGQPDQFESWSEALGRWYDVRAYQTTPRHFAVVFTDITERKQAEIAVQEAHEQLQAQTEELQTANEELHAQAEGLRASNEELRKQELALRESEERYRRFFDEDLTGDFLARPDGTVLECNPAFAKIYGFPDLVAAAQCNLSQFNPEDWRRLTARLKREREVQGHQCVHRRPDGTEIHVVANVVGSLDEAGELREIKGYIFDNTERKRAEDQSLRLNRTLRALSNSSQALTHATEESAYLQEVCRIVVQDCGHAMVWVGYAEQDEAKSIRPVAYAGFEEGYLETLHLTWDDTERGRGPTGAAIRTGRPTLCRNMLTDPSFTPWRPQALQRGYASSIGLPLLTEGQAFGALTIYSREPDPFAPDEIQLLTELAADLAHGITTLRLRAAHAQAEESLRESEARLRLAQDAANAGTWEWDLQTNRNFWSEELWKLYGLEPHSCEPSYEAWRQTVLPEDRPGAERSVQEAARRGMVLNAEWRVRDPQGQERWLMSRGQPVRDAQGRTTSYRGIVLDITDRKHAEEALRESERALRESEQRLRLALEGGGMGRWEWDVRNDVAFWDERVYELLGLYPAGPASSQIFFRAIDNRDQNAVRQLVEKSLAGGEGYRAEFRVNHAGGETLWLVSQGKVIREEQGQAVRMMGVLYDITQRKQMEADLRRLNDQLEEEVQAQTEELKDTVDRLQDEVARRVLAEGKLRRRSQMLEAFFQHTITPLAFLDKYFNFVRVNAAYAQADAKDPQYFVGRNHFALYPHDENRAIFEQVVQTRQPYFAYAKPFTYPDAPQRVTYWDWQLTPLLDEQGDVQFLVLNLEDVTEQQTAFQELEQRAHQLQRLTLELSQAEDRERKRLAQILHDDLQQQLAAAKFHLSLLGHRAPKDAAFGRAVAQLDQILKDAIEKSRSLSHELSPAVLYHSDLGETFEWLARQLKAKHGLTVHVESRGRIDSASEPLKVFLYRTAREILFNVVKHARVPEARLRLQRLRGGIWLTISDQGQGFDPRALGQAEGFGLLSIRERIELLGGRMKVRSAPGRGSTFLIAVPDGRQPEDGRQATVGVGPRAYPTPVTAGSHGGLPLRVLLVDDHKIMREGLATLLNEQSDLEVVGQAGNGREAVELANRLRPDVIVMDAAMPLMAGDEATRQIKGQWPHIRIVALSMFEEADLSEAMYRAGAERYLLKTGPSDELLAAIRGRPAAPGQG